jgi:hypothetical protein
MGPRAGLDEVVKRKNFPDPDGTRTTIIQPVAQCYTTELTRLLTII